MISTSLFTVFMLLQPGVRERPAPPKPIVLKAARLFDGKSESLLRERDGDG